MIIANVYAIQSPAGDYLQLKFQDPEGKTDFAFARDLTEAKRMVYFRNRRYIHDKLTAWLHQREHAITPFPKTRDYHEKLAAIQLALVKLEYFRQSGFWSMCAMVVRERQTFYLVAPKEESRFYNYFKATIEPILLFCAEMKGGTE